MYRFGFCRHFISPLVSSSIEHVGMDDLHEPVVVPVVHRYPDYHGSLHREGALQRWRDLIGLFYPEPVSAEGLGKWHDVDGAELDSGSAAVLGQLLKSDHVIRTVDPHQVDEVA